MVHVVLYIKTYSRSLIDGDKLKVVMQILQQKDFFNNSQCTLQNRKKVYCMRNGAGCFFLFLFVFCVCPVKKGSQKSYSTQTPNYDKQLLKHTLTETIQKYSNNCYAVIRICTSSAWDTGM